MRELTGAERDITASPSGESTILLFYSVNSLDDYLVGEDPGVAAVAGMPRGNLAEVHCFDTDEARLTRRDVLDELLRDCADIDRRVGTIGNIVWNR